MSNKGETMLIDKISKDYLLDDKAIQEFLLKGYVLIQTDHEPGFHQEISGKLTHVLEEEGNPGNNILPRIPQLSKVFSNEPVRGALTSLLGPDYTMHPHRYCHLNRPGSKGQNWHKDDYIFDQNVRHHRFRWVMAFYYPQEVTADMGPTGIMPGRHFFNSISSSEPDQSIEEEYKLCGPAGTVAIVNFDVWHRATANTSDKNRLMLKFQFLRMSEPMAPSWDNREEDWLIERKEDSELGSEDIWHWLRGESNPKSVYNERLSNTVDRLGSDEEHDRLKAIYELGCMGEEAVEPLIVELRNQAQNLDENTLGSSPADPQGSNPAELSAAHALARIGGDAVDQLVHELSHEDWRIRAVSADILGDIGCKAVAAADQLNKLLVDKNTWVRRNAAEALGYIGVVDETTVNALVGVLTDEDERVRRNAALTLAKIGPLAKNAVEILAGLVSDESRYVRYNTVLALRRIGTPEALVILWDEFESTRWCEITTADSPY